MSVGSQSSEILINVKGPNELKLQITISTDKSVLELKQAIEEKSQVEADRQRLIYAGRVLKDGDALAVYKIQSNNTIHMVKGAARSSASSSQQQSAPQALPTMQAGQNPHDPLTQLNSHLGYGAMAGLNPFSGLGFNQNDPNMLQSMMNSPEFLQQMSSLMSNPAIIDQIIASNPELAAMGPQAREVLQSDRFRELMSNPERLQAMLQMSSMLREAGALGGMGQARPTFPAPGTPSTGNLAPANNAPTTGQLSPQSGTVPPNPFAALFPPLAGGTGTGSGASPGGFNPLGMMQQMAALNMGGLGSGFGAPALPTDPRPPEERFQVQLQQLQDMGFTNASQNVRALLATGGNVHSAIEYILGGGGL